MSQGIRHNEGKPQWSQVDFKSLEPMVRVLEAGEKVVGKSNWKKGLLILEVCESLLRHTFSYMDGEDNDQKSGQPHVGHIMANAMFLSHMHLFRPDMDNREKEEEQDNFFDAPASILKFALSNKRGLQCFPEDYSDKKLISELDIEVDGQTLKINAGTTVRDVYNGIRKLAAGLMKEPKGGVLDESNFRQVAENFADRWRSYKEEPPRILTPIQASFEKAIQNAKVGAQYPKRSGCACEGKICGVQSNG